MVQKEIEIAEFYIERETWLLSINRAKIVIEYYQDSIWSHRALEIMVEDYKNLSLNDLAVDAKRVLSLNEPGFQKQALSPDEKQGKPPAIARNLNPAQSKL